MTDSFEQFEGLAKKAKLMTPTRDEKLRAHKTLLDFMESHPVRVENNIRQINTRSLLFAQFFTRIHMFPALLIITLLAGGSASLAAEGTVPGDLLYPIKVQINENIRGTLSFSSEAKTAWDTRRAERRLEEAETLASQGRLNADARAQIESNFKTHAESVRARIDEFKSKENLEAAADASSRFETSLRVHDRILARLAETEHEMQAEVKSVQKEVRKEADATAKVRTGAEAKVSAQASANVEAAAQGKLIAAKNKVAEVRKFIETKKTSVSTEATAQAEAELEIAQKAIVEGQTKLEAKTYGEALQLFQRAVRIAQEAKLLLNANESLKVEVKIPGLILKAGDEGKAKIKSEEKAEIKKEKKEIKSESEVDTKSQIRVDIDDIHTENETKLEVEIGL